MKICDGVVCCNDSRSTLWAFKASSKISTDLDNLYTVLKPLTHTFRKCKIWLKFLALRGGGGGLNNEILRLICVVCVQSKNQNTLNHFYQEWTSKRLCSYRNIIALGWEYQHLTKLTWNNWSQIMPMLDIIPRYVFFAITTFIALSTINSSRDVHSLISL